MSNKDDYVISAASVKELRALSGAGMMDCRNALVESEGDLEKARDFLRKKGVVKAEKKSSRVSAEGVIAIKSDGSTVKMLEINSETDFVAKNESFQRFCVDVLDSVMKVEANDLDGLMNQKYLDSQNNIQEELVQKIASIGENISIRRVASFQNDSGLVSCYLHSAIADNLGKLGVIISVDGEVTDESKELARKLCMHIAASDVLALTRDDLPEEFLKKEEAIFREQVLSSGKSGELAEKILLGKLNKRCEEVVLLDQVFIMDGKKSIKQIIHEFEKENSSKFSISGFRKFVLGEGIEKESVDFAEEVLKLTS